MTGWSSRSASTISWTTLRFAYDLAKQDGILIKLCTPIEAPIAKFFKRFQGHVREDQSLLIILVAPHALDGFTAFMARKGNPDVIYR
jgi:uncharacterized membrane protein